jgi:hypothetical protein
VTQAFHFYKVKMTEKIGNFIFFLFFILKPSQWFANFASKHQFFCSAIESKDTKLLNLVAQTFSFRSQSVYIKKENFF